MKYVIEQHDAGFLAYPLGMKGVVIGQGDTRDAALADAESAAKLHQETFGEESIGVEPQPIDADVDDG